MLCELLLPLLLYGWEYMCENGASFIINDRSYLKDIYVYKHMHTFNEQAIQSWAHETCIRTQTFFLLQLRGFFGSLCTYYTFAGFKTYTTYILHVIWWCWICDKKKNLSTLSILQRRYNNMLYGCEKSLGENLGEKIPIDRHYMEAS